MAVPLRYFIMSVVTLLLSKDLDMFSASSWIESSFVLMCPRQMFQQLPKRPNFVQPRWHTVNLREKTKTRSKPSPCSENYLESLIFQYCISMNNFMNKL